MGRISLVSDGSTRVEIAEELGPSFMTSRVAVGTRPAAKFQGRISAVEKLLLSPQEAADCLGISRSRLYDLIRKREIVSILIGRSRRIPAVELRDYVQRLTESAWVA